MSVPKSGPVGPYQSVAAPAQESAAGAPQKPHQKSGAKAASVALKGLEQMHSDIKPQNLPPKASSGSNQKSAAELTAELAKEASPGYRVWTKASGVPIEQAASTQALAVPAQDVTPDVMKAIGNSNVQKLEFLRIEEDDLSLISQNLKKLNLSNLELIQIRKIPGLDS